jgi:hypothetical protein
MSTSEAAVGAGGVPAGTAAVKDAAVVELKPGDHMDVGVLRLIGR